MPFHCIMLLIMGNVKRPKGELRKLAQGAMKRMKTGYWQQAKETKEAAKAQAVSEGRDAAGVDNFYRSKFEADLKVTVMPPDDSMYLKVCRMLDRDSDITNPIAELIDKDKYAALDGSGKQRYIMTLSAKYQELSERYRLERKKIN